MNCKRFRDLLYLFQAEELNEAEHLACQAHLDACETCAGVAEEEARLLRVVRSKLSRTPAPPGLETRVRAALRTESDRSRGRSWVGRPWFAVTAAAVLLIAVLVPTLLTTALPDGRAGEGARLRERVMVVDYDCDVMGKSIEAQRKCTHPLHLNALRRANGEYLYVNPEQEEYRDLLLARDARGLKLVVSGETLPGTTTIRVESVEMLEARGAATRGPAVLAAAVSP
jgi:hypothetical protein